MRLILALSIALGTSNLMVAPTDAGPDSMTRATTSTREHVAATTAARAASRQAKTTAAFDRARMFVSIGARAAGATPSARLTGFTFRAVDDSANVAAEDVTTTDALSAIAVH